jgi:hypothetical protein
MQELLKRVFTCLLCRQLGANLFIVRTAEMITRGICEAELCDLRTEEMQTRAVYNFRNSLACRLRMVSPLKNAFTDTKLTCARVTAVNGSQIHCHAQTLPSSAQQMRGMLTTKATTVAASAHRSRPSASKVPHSLNFSVEKGKNEFFRSRRTRRPDLRVPTDSQAYRGLPERSSMSVWRRQAVGPVWAFIISSMRGYAKLLLQYRQNLPFYMSTCVVPAYTRSPCIDHLATGEFSWYTNGCGTVFAVAS